MHPIRRRRLTMVLLLVLGVTFAVGLTLYALKQNINLFYTPTQVDAGEVQPAQLIRLGGIVKEHSVVRQADGLSVVFTLTDFSHDVTVHYKGVLPDLFREGQGIVTQGSLNGQGEFVANEVLAKHSSEYMPKRVKDALAQKIHQQKERSA